ncbi:hypothetical protein [Allonocardiopsis opalescens]|uniref:Uncharacterized protein n=1 Tax=Allonocardiopsis opalescens TaxID=1144618 RepID=A0A2T0QCG0_9ACTN|nr:hypothetical protein [Allonocardiopsis opalescens]PRY01561.1 hypothetical protein CLV72_101144 [Allonocardiopsis opalescens]
MGITTGTAVRVLGTAAAAAALVWGLGTPAHARTQYECVLAEFPTEDGIRAILCQGEGTGSGRLFIISEAAAYDCADITRNDDGSVDATGCAEQG